MATNICGTFSTLDQRAAPEPFQHVFYSLGMVLGVDDLDQEFAYLNGHTHWLTRDMLGYGTICGLDLSYDYLGEALRIVVNPGTAITARGELVRVPTKQCADVYNWMDNPNNPVPAANSWSYEGRDYATLYVVLSYRPCPTLPMPIPGEPCRSEAEVTIPSRWQDDFNLCLSYTRPAQRQEMAVRDFCDWLRMLELTDEPLNDLEDYRIWFEDEIRNAIPYLMSPPKSPPADSPDDYILNSPPSGLRIPRNAIHEYWRLAFRVWTTEVRKHWRELGQDCIGSLPESGEILLGEVHLPLDPKALDNYGKAHMFYEDERPYLLPLRMLQEWLGSLEAAVAPIVPGNEVQPLNWPILNPDGSIADDRSDPGMLESYSRSDHVHALPENPVPPHNISEDAHRNLLISGNVTGTADKTIISFLFDKKVADPSTLSQDGNVLQLKDDVWKPMNLSIPTAGTSVEPEQGWGQTPNAGLSRDERYSRSTHTHGTPPDPMPDHVVSNTAHNSHSIGGSNKDVGGTLSNPQVNGLLGALIVTPVTDGKILQYRDGQWHPIDLPTGGTPSAPEMIAAGKYDFRDGILVALASPIGNLVATQIAPTLLPQYFLLTFDQFQPKAAYVVKGTPLNSPLISTPRVFEAIEFEPDKLESIMKMFPELYPLEELANEGILGDLVSLLEWVYAVLRMDIEQFGEGNDPDGFKVRTILMEEFLKLIQESGGDDEFPLPGILVRLSGWEGEAWIQRGFMTEISYATDKVIG